MTVPSTPTTPEDFCHSTRFSDSSLFDEICAKCGATDRIKALYLPCQSADKEPFPGAIITFG